MIARQQYKHLFETIFSDRQRIVEKVNVAGAVITRIGDNGEILVLLIQRSPKDHWPLHFEIPRGKCDQGINEKIIPCLKREVKEETGLDVDVIRFIDKFTYLADNGRRESTQYNYLCSMVDPEQPIKLSKEHSDYKWITSVGEAELLTMPEIKKTIAKIMDLDERIVDYPENDFTDKPKLEEK